MKGIIYKYTFPDGKVYIGQTRNPEKRKREHVDPKIGPVNTGFGKHISVMEPLNMKLYAR